MKFDKSMKHSFPDIGKAIAHCIKPSKELDKLISCGDSKPLRDYLKKAFGNSGHYGGDVDYSATPNKGLEISPLDNNSLTLSWSQVATLLRDDDFREKYVFIKQQENKTVMQEQWDNTHLCGNRFDTNVCEYFLQTDSNGTTVNGKKLDRSCYYCTSENRVRKIGSGGSWTGLSPKFCPKRKALAFEQRRANGELFENSEQLMDEGWRFAFSESSAPLISKVVHGHNEKEEGNVMARKMQFDTAIAKDMQSAALDSFIDNMRMINIDDIRPNDDNFYEMSDIELLADDIERVGLKHNIVVVKDPVGEKYTVKSGHRRLAAIKLLIEQKRCSIKKIPCTVDGQKTQAEEQFDLIMLNATQRKYSDADMLHEYEEIERTFKALEVEGKPLKGRIRDNIAAVLKVSPAQVGKIENIKRNAIPVVEQAVKNGAMSISTANEIAKLSEEKQQEIVEKSPKVSHKEVKEVQKQEKSADPPKSVKCKAPVDSSFENDRLIDNIDDDTEDIEDNGLDEPVVKSEKKSSLVYSLVFSDDEIKTLLDFVNDNLIYADDEDSITAILRKIHAVYGE